MDKSVSRILESFKENAFSIQSYFKRFSELAHEEDKSAVTNMVEYLKTSLNEMGIDITKIKEDHKPSDDEIEMFLDKFMRAPKLSHHNYEIMSRSSFLMLNNYFEYLISDLLAYYYVKFRESLNEKEFKLTIKELNEYETIQDAINDLVIKKVESMIVDYSFPELLDHFKSHLEIELEDKVIDWDKIYEFRERRHLIVHNSSKVNKKYLSRTGNPFGLKIGDTIEVSGEYFDNAFEEFYLAGIVLSYNCWGKWDKEDSNDAISNILMETFDKCLNSGYGFTERLTDYAEKIEARNEVQEDLLLRIKFNRCIALKRNKKTTELKKTLKKIKIGTALPLFQLAHSILSDEKEKVTELVKKTAALEDIDLERYREWPIYGFVREDAELNQQVLDILEKLS